MLAAVRAAASILLILSAVPARADVELGARPELRLSAGWDDNLFLDAQPSGPNPRQIQSDAIFDIEPRLFGWLSIHRHTLTLGVDYLERVTPHTGDLRDLGIMLGWRSAPLGPLTLILGARYEHWATSFYPEDTFDLGGADAGLQLALGCRVTVNALYRFGARAYSDSTRNGQLDLDQRARATVGVTATRWLRLEAAYTYTHVGSNSASAELERHRAELWLWAAPLSWLSIAAGYGVGPQHVPYSLVPSGKMTVPRDDLQHTFDVQLSAYPLRWLEVFARYSLLVSTSDAPTGTYHRDQVVAGLGVHWDFTRSTTSPKPLAPRRNGEQVTFRHRAAPGRQVAVVGDWNGWAPQPLDDAGGGLYQGTYKVPTGRHEYALTVDGELVEPPDAAAYAPDGFGGKNGILNVE
jgi:hypothetical protein